MKQNIYRKRKKNIVLVNYYNPIFWPFAQRLESDGFQVFWINSRPISSQWLRNLGVPNERICEVMEQASTISQESEAVQIVSEFEQPHLPTINSIILMDRVLKHGPYKDALVYLAQSAQIIKKFLLDRDIRLVSSGRDTSLQLLTMLICKKLDIFWGCVTRVKLPSERFGFTVTHQGDEFYKIREAQKDDYERAAKWLYEYRSDFAMRPLALLKIRGFNKLFARTGKYLSTFAIHLNHNLKTRSDRKVPGSSFRLYMGNYLREIRNYSYYRFFLKFSQPEEEPFVLYGLHRQPESSVDVRGAFFDDQLALIKQIARSLFCTHKLYVKVHFSDVAGQSAQFYKAIKGLPGVKLVDPDVDSRELIRRASVIVTNSGAMGQEGGYLGRPVIAMSKMFWCKLPSVVYCSTPPELPQLINRMIKSPPSVDDSQITKVIAELFANSFSCDPNMSFLGKEYSESDLAILSKAYAKLFKLIEIN